MKIIAFVVFLAAASAASLGDDPAPGLASAGSLTKVTELLEGLKADVIEEGKEEATAYDKFSCWCKDTTEEVSTNVKDGIDAINAASAAIESANAKITQEQETLAEKQGDLTNMHKRWATETKTFEAYKALHMETVGDLDMALTAIQEVQEMLKNANTAFLQTHQSMMSFAPIAASPILVALLQEPTANADGEKGEYKDTLSEGEIMSLLDSFKEKLSTEQKARTTEYNKRKEAYSEQWKTAEGATNPDVITAIEDEIDTCKDEISSQETEIGKQETAMAEAQTTLNDDQTFLKKATEQCETKARIWDQRSALRAEEVQMLAQAVGILKGIDEEGFFFFLQTDAHPVKKALAKAKAVKAIRKENASKKVTETKETEKKPAPAVRAHEDKDVPEAEPAENVAMSNPTVTAFSRAKAHNTKDAVIEGEYRVWKDAKGRTLARSWIGNTQQGREHIARSNAKDALLQVDGLAHLQAEVMRDPFVRVRKTINDMIERLLQEAKDEASQHGWCQTELAKVAKTIEFEQPRSLKYSARVVELESEMDTLSEEITELAGNADKDEDGTIKEAEDTLAEATESRSTEKELNTKAMADAEKAIDAVGKALVLLQDFYNRAGAQGSQKVALKKEVSGRAGREFSEEGPTKQYGGNQEAAGGILGLLEVVKAKYEQENAEIKQNEKESTSEYNALKADLTAKIEGMKMTKKLKKQALEKAESSHTNNEEKLKSTLSMIDTALKTQAKLRPACLNKGPTAAERKEQIEGQIEALNAALEALKSD